MKTVESKSRGKERDKKPRPENDSVNSPAVREMKKVKRDEPPASNDHLSPPKKRALDGGMSPKKQSPGDFYHEVITKEENEAEVLSGGDAKTLHQETCADILSTLKEALDLKLKPDKDSKDKAALDGCRKRIVMGSTFLKKLNRLEKYHVKLSRNQTLDAKKQVDGLHLQLQNLLYELQHLQKEVQKCLNFRSQDEAIDLVPEDEFFKEAPAELYDAVLGMCGKRCEGGNVSGKRKEGKGTKCVYVLPQAKIGSDAHLLRLARLGWELEERKRLARDCQQVKAAKEVQLMEIQRKQATLRNLEPMLASILQACNPLLEAFSLPSGHIRELQHKAYYLPSPLYILYVQACAYVDAFDKKVVAVIHGNEEEAKTLTHSHNQLRDDSDSEAEGEETRKKRHKKRRNEAERDEERRKRALAHHPLSVSLSIVLPDGSTIVLQFRYVDYFNLVTVKVTLNISPDSAQAANSSISGNLLDPENILSHLFPGDSGEESPNPTTRHHLKEVKVESWAELVPQLGIPYHWAQKMAGLDFLPLYDVHRDDNVGGGSRGTLVKANPEVSARCIKDVIDAIRERVASRVALQKQIVQIESLHVSVSNGREAVYSGKIGSKLSSWKSISWGEYSSASTVIPIVREELVSPHSRFYRALLERGSAARIVALIAVDPDYPRKIPLFSLSLKWRGERTAKNDENVRNRMYSMGQELERELNVHLDGVGRKEEILSLQLHRLLLGMDVYLESTCLGDNPAEFPKEKLFFAQARGRNQVKPLHYLTELDVFVQR
ncbi:unnamed protein product [Darwinula stevensoni]|uniref:THO complex subunit 5 n=1 Tax=Darwinula stevensoni TaxID=69355 RepID=A0A7R9A616_9CRUS|nr:unnamed protein product [Darwinula stevensoni]CAG0887791.1 unnamed protein product [Darwinula stevensoni]